jgi:hypothetical protein
MNPPSPVPETMPTGSDATPLSLPARLFNVFAAPGEVFDSVKPAAVAHANWLVPALIIMVVSCLGAWLIFSQPAINQQLSEITDKAIDKQVEKGKLSPKQAEAAKETTAKFAGIGAKVGAVYSAVFPSFITPFWWGLILWLVGTKVLKGSFGYMKAVEVAGLAGMITALEAIVRSLLIVGLGSLYASPSLVLLVKDFDPQNPVHSLLAAFNLMTFWLLGVRAIGLARLSGASFGRAAAWVFGLWAAFMGLMLGLGFALRAAFGG